MADVVEVANPDNGPVTHILIVGVGDYHFLSGGADPHNKFEPQVKDLKCLTSPQVSAASVAEWFYNNRGSLHRPLGSMQVHIGDGSITLDGAPIQASNATKELVQNAAAEWKDRLDSDENNVGILFFCGHGLTYQDFDEHLLLLQDFGSLAGGGELWERAWNITQFYRAMKSCRAKTQLYLIDACREKGPNWLATGKDRSSRFISLTPSESFDKSAPMIQSTNLNGLAPGNTNGSSPFTLDLLGVLQKYGAKAKGNQFIVTTRSIHSALPEVANIRRPDKEKVVPSGTVVEDLPILKISQPISLAKVTSSPPGLTRTARLLCSDARDSMTAYDGQEEPVTFDLGLGRYRFKLQSAKSLGQEVEADAVLPITEVVVS